MDDSAVQKCRAFFYFDGQSLHCTTDHDAFFVQLGMKKYMALCLLHKATLDRWPAFQGCSLIPRHKQVPKEVLTDTQEWL